MRCGLNYCDSVIKDAINNADFFATCKYLSPWAEKLESNKQPNVQVVTCFLERDNKILVLQRGKKDAQYELWGIPGGKLSSSELPTQGLIREIFEETGALLSESCFTHLGSAISNTSTDGCYGLHLYHAHFPSDKTLPVINQDEHLSYQWVSIENFMNLDLLHAQREAFLFVYSNLLRKISP